MLIKEELNDYLNNILNSDVLYRGLVFNFESVCFDNYGILGIIRVEYFYCTKCFVIYVNTDYLVDIEKFDLIPFVSSELKINVEAIGSKVGKEYTIYYNNKYFTQSIVRFNHFTIVLNKNMVSDFSEVLDKYLDVNIKVNGSLNVVNNNLSPFYCFKRRVTFECLYYVYNVESFGRRMPVIISTLYNIYLDMLNIIQFDMNIQTFKLYILFNEVKEDINYMLNLVNCININLKKDFFKEYQILHNILKIEFDLSLDNILNYTTYENLLMSFDIDKDHLLFIKK